MLTYQMKTGDNTNVVRQKNAGNNMNEASIPQRKIEAKNNQNQKEAATILSTQNEQCRPKEFETQRTLSENVLLESENQKKKCIQNKENKIKLQFG